MQDFFCNIFSIVWIMACCGGVTIKHICIVLFYARKKCLIYQEAFVKTSKCDICLGDDQYQTTLESLDDYFLRTKLLKTSVRFRASLGFFLFLKPSLIRIRRVKILRWKVRLEAAIKLVHFSGRDV